MKEHRKVLAAVFLALALIALNLGLSGCSAPTNVIAGLSTPQSTISGSTQVFAVDQSNTTQRLVVDFNPALAGENINADDHFVIKLDSGFLKFLQAVDPYVVIYSECWMGSEPSPVKPEERHRQIVLIKDGLSHNARLPITGVPLFGPVTMGKDYLPVTVTLKVVVLAKHDNQQTIQLLNAVTSTAAVAAPQYAVASGAAASVGAAIVSLNRDKIEFEHTITFYPTKEPIMTPRGLDTLRTGKMVILKGENRYRMVPYQTWYYYLYPLNWFGHQPDGVSRQYEFQYDRPAYGWDFSSYIWLVTRAPVYLVRSLFAPSTWGRDKFEKATMPDKLRLSPNNDLLKDVKGGVKEESLFEQFYSEKTFFVLEIQKTPGTRGAFGKLKTDYAAEATVLNNLLTSPEGARAQTNKEIGKAFDSLKRLAMFERARKLLKEDANDNQIDTSSNAVRALISTNFYAGDVNAMTEDQDALLAHSLRYVENAKIKRYVEFARTVYFENLRADSSKSDPESNTNVFPTLIAQMKKDELKDPKPDFKTKWDNTWKNICNTVKSIVSSFSPKVREGFNETEYAKLESPKTQDNNTSTPVPRSDSAPPAPTSPPSQ